MLPNRAKSGPIFKLLLFHSAFFYVGFLNRDYHQDSTPQINNNSQAIRQYLLFSRYYRFYNFTIATLFLIAKLIIFLKLLKWIYFLVIFSLPLFLLFY